MLPVHRKSVYNKIRVDWSRTRKHCIQKQAGPSMNQPEQTGPSMNQPEQTSQSMNQPEQTSQSMN